MKRLPAKGAKQGVGVTGNGGPGTPDPTRL